MFEQAFKNVDDVLWKEAGCTTELDYTEQPSWPLFLKYLDSLEGERAMEAELEGRPYTFLLDTPYRWESWAAFAKPSTTCTTADASATAKWGRLRAYHGRPRHAPEPHLLRQGKEEPRLRHRHHEHDPARDRGAEHCPHQHADGKPRRHSGKDRFGIVLANPPFGGKERPEVQQNFPICTGETAFLFLQHFIKILKAGGCGGIVIKNTFLSNSDNASVSLRRLLLESANLHTVLDCPGGTFQGAGVKTVVLFFEKGAPTRKVWFY